MSKNENVFKTSLLAAAAVAGALSASFAQAANLGDCLTTRQVKEELMGKEGQKILIVANQTVVSPEVKDIGLLFTADAQGRTGYMLESDKPIGQPATCFKVSMKFNDVYINKDPGVPARILEGTNAAVAKKQCDEKVRTGLLGKGSCGSLNEVLTVGTKAGYRVLFWATSSTGAKITLEAKVSDDGSPAVGSPAAGAGVLLASSYEGATTPLNVVTGTSFTGDFLTLVNNRQSPIVAQLGLR